MSQREVECFGARKRERRDFFGLVEFGFFLILIGAIFLITPNTFNKVKSFFNDFNATTEISPGISLPTPVNNHPGIYSAVMYFCLAFGMFEIVILILRFAQKSPLRKKAGTLGSIVFLLGAGIFASALVKDGRFWLFVFELIVLVGLSIIVRSIVTIFSRST